MVVVSGNVSKNNEKKIAKNSTVNTFEIKIYHWIEYFIAVILISNMIILYNKHYEKFAIKKIKSVSD